MLVDCPPRDNSVNDTGVHFVLSKYKLVCGGFHRLVLGDGSLQLRQLISRNYSSCVLREATL